MTSATPHPHPRWRVLALLGAALLVALVAGATSATTEAGFGPHRATYETTTTGTVVVDLGPLGTVVLDSPLPLGLGVRARVQEVPEDVSALTDADTLAALSGDLDAYLQFFSAPRTTVELVTRALVADAAQRAAMWFVALVAGGLAVRALLGPVRRAELADRVRPWTRHLAGVTALLVGCALVLTAAAPRAAVDGGPVTSPVFAGTPLEGARVTGRLGGVVDTYGARLVDAFRDNQAFYAAADRALDRAWQQRIEADAGQRALLAAIGRPAAEPGDLVTVLLISDLHCNVSMTPLITTTARHSGAALVLDAGDTTINGTTVEQYCVEQVAAAIPDGVPLVVAPGNHDTDVSSALYARAGATVLAGEVVEVAGLRILGDADPNRTGLGEGTFTARGETLGEAGERLAEVACAERPDLLLVHTPVVGTAALQDGCVPAQLSGHMHTRADPVQVGRGVRYVSGSTAGVVKDRLPVGTLKGVAEMTVLRVDAASRRVVEWQLVEVLPDGSARVGAPRPWPVPVPEVLLPAEEGAAAPGPTDAATPTLSP